MNVCNALLSIPTVSYVASALSIGFVTGWIWSWLNFSLHNTSRSREDNHER